MALPLFFMVAGSLVRAAGPRIASSLAKFARQATKTEIKKGGAKTVNNNNLGLMKTLARGDKAPKTMPKTTAPKSGAPKSTPKTQPKTKADTKTAPKTKTQAKTKADTKTAPKTKTKTKTTQKKQQTKKDEKKSVFGDKYQRGLIIAGTTAATLMDSEPKQKADASPTPDKTNRNKSQGGRAMGEGVSKKEKSFGQAFSEAYEKGVGTKFTHKGKQYTAVKDTDVKKAGAKDLRDYLNKKAGKAAKGMYASKKNIGANDYRMGGMLISVEDRRKMK